MIEAAECVVIGSGALGASVAFHLARAGRQVALVDKHALGSQTSPRCRADVAGARHRPDDHARAAGGAQDRGVRARDR
jgi:glycine/D-amino acid oxidase-like deaminating enzyme